MLSAIFYHTFFTDEIIRFRDDDPLALNCHFRWILSGNLKTNQNRKNHKTHTFLVANRKISNCGKLFIDNNNFVDNCFSNAFTNKINENCKKNLFIACINKIWNYCLKQHTELLPDDYKLARSKLFGLRKQLNFDPELR